MSGNYQVNGAIHSQGNGTDNDFISLVANQTTLESYGSRGAARGINPISVISDVVSLNQGDQLQLHVYTGNGSTSVFGWFSGHLLK